MMTIHPENFSKTIQSAIDDLAAFDLIPAIDKANILLVLSGHKPSMHTGFFSDFMAIEQVPPESHSRNKTTLGRIIADLGLEYKTQITHLEKEIDGIHSYAEWVVFCTAKESDIAIELFDARESHNEKREGILLGFPESAVNAFVNSTMIDIGAVPVSTEHVTAVEMKFLNYRLSSEHWKDEIKYLPNFARTIKLISPRIYDQCIST